MRVLISLGIFLLFFSGCDRQTDVNGNDGLPPGVPEGLRVYFAGDGEVVIDWIRSSEPDIKRYKIYKSTDSVNYAFLDFSTDDYYIDDSLSYDSVYYYKISVEDVYNQESTLTEAVRAKPINRDAPRSPSDVFINARNWNGAKSIYLNWIRNSETDLAGYRIYRSDLSGFSADSSTFIGLTAGDEFEDTQAKELYKYYFYLVTAVDKGGLESKPSQELSDRIFEEPELILPMNNSSVQNFSQFIFKGVGVPASYKIIVQSNIFFDEIWQTDISSSGSYDTIRVNIPGGLFSYNSTYYWRVASFSESSQPNSITPLFKFTIKP